MTGHLGLCVCLLGYGSLGLLLANHQADPSSILGGGVAGGVTSLGVSGYVLWHLLNKRIPAMETMLGHRDRLIREIVTAFREESESQRTHHRKIEDTIWQEMRNIHEVQHSDARQLLRAVNKLSALMDTIPPESGSDIHKPDPPADT